MDALIKSCHFRYYTEFGEHLNTFRYRTEMEGDLKIFDIFVIVGKLTIITSTHALIFVMVLKLKSTNTPTRFCYRTEIKEH